MSKRKLLHLCGIVVMVCASAFFLRALLPHIGQLNALLGDPHFVAALGVTGAVYLMIHCIMGWAWYWLIRATGNALPWYRCLAIFSISQMGKYLPGNFMQHVGRVALARREGLPTAELIVTALWELSGVLLAGSTVSFACFILLPAELYDGLLGAAAKNRVWLFASVVGLMLVGSVILFRWLQRRSATAAGSHALPIALTCCSAYCLVFILHGWSLDWIGQAIGAPSQLATAIAIYTIAWIAGFVIPGAVGGLGVRESVMLLGLTPLVGDESAVVLAVSMRVVSTFGDGVAYLIGLSIPSRSGG